jgi:hypothetical protein
MERITDRDVFSDSDIVLIIWCFDWNLLIIIESFDFVGIVRVLMNFVAFFWEKFLSRTQCPFSFFKKD